MKKFAKQLIEFMAGNTLVFNLFRFINKNKLIILYYHRVVKKEDLVNITNKHLCVDTESFENQMKFLSQFYNPIGEKEVILAIEGKSKIPEYSVWVTFDDGFKDNYKNAYPILKKYKIPATFFITTGFVDGQVMPCEDYIEKAIRMSNLKEIKFNLNKEAYKYSLHSEEQKTNTIKSLLAVMRDKNITEDKYLKELIESFKIQTKDITELFMSWNDVKELRNNGFSIGAHTVNHKILSNLSKEEITKEIFESKYEIEKNLGENIFSFAYPRGKKEDFNVGICLPILQLHGFKLIVTTIGGSNNLVLNKTHFNLKRIGVSYGDTLNFFKFKVAAGSFWQI